MIEEPIVTIIDICHVQIIVSTMSDTKPYLFLANRIPQTALCTESDENHTSELMSAEQIPLLQRSC